MRLSLISVPKKNIDWAVLDPRGVLLVSGYSCSRLACREFEQRHSIRWDDAQLQGYELCEMHGKAD